MGEQLTDIIIRHELAVIRELIHHWDHATLEENYIRELGRAERLARSLRRCQCGEAKK